LIVAKAFSAFIAPILPAILVTSLSAMSNLLVCLAGDPSPFTACVIVRANYFPGRRSARLSRLHRSMVDFHFQLW
jgi:hypothetical protein